MNRGMGRLRPFSRAEKAQSSTLTDAEPKTRRTSAPKSPFTECAGLLFGCIVLFMLWSLARPKERPMVSPDPFANSVEAPSRAEISAAEWATPAGTARFAARFSNSQYRVTATGLTMSTIGMGTYQGDMSDATDALVTQAVIQSVSAGVNHIDTASNYRRGRGEASVGRALKELFARGITRDEIVVTTKAGFISTPELAKEARRLGATTADFDAEGRHCVAKPCLQASLEFSLKRLGLACVDVLYIHNLCEKRSELGTAQLLDLLQTAFAYLETERKNKRIRYYGLATFSKTFRAPSATAGSLRLATDVWPIVTRLNNVDPGFRFIQVPMSWNMPETYTKQWEFHNGRPATLNETAAKLGVLLVSSKSLGKRMGDGVYIPGCIDDSLLSSVTSDTAAQILQLTRSTPGLATALVGHKQPDHVAANLALLQRPPLSPADFHRAISGCILGSL